MEAGCAHLASLFKGVIEARLFSASDMLGFSVGEDDEQYQLFAEYELLLCESHKQSFERLPLLP